MHPGAIGTPSQSGRRPSPAAPTGGREPAKPMSVEHKRALADGRTESRAVRRYLEALNAVGAADRSTPADLAERIDAIDAQLAAAKPEIKVRLIIERLDLYAKLKASGGRQRLDELEDAFVAAAGGYSARKGISYTAWRQVGVSDEVLQRAGISPPA